MLVAITTLAHLISSAQPATVLLTAIGGLTIVVNALTPLVNKLTTLVAALARLRSAWRRLLSSRRTPTRQQSPVRMPKEKTCKIESPSSRTMPEAKAA